MVKMTGSAEIAAMATRAPAVNRAAALLRLLGSSHEPMRMTTIARELDMTPSTCQHILRALVDEGFVSVDGKRYGLALGVVALAKDILSGGPSLQVIQQELQDIADAFDVTTCVLQRDFQDRMTVIAAAYGDNVYGIQLDIGRRVPAFIAALGRCVAAQSGLSVASLRRRFSSLIWEQPPTFEDWMQQIQSALVAGVGEDHGNYMRGYSVFACPIYEGDRITRGISTICATEQLDADETERLIGQMRAAAARLST